MPILIKLKRVEVYKKLIHKVFMPFIYFFVHVCKLKYLNMNNIDLTKNQDNFHA